MAYVLSALGSWLGLQCALRGRYAQGGARAAWLLGAAVAIGWTGIWVMHFVAMLGFRVSGHPIRYDIPITLLSAVTAVAVVGLGLFVVGYWESGTPALLVGGALTGVGVAAMHYMGMKAMHTGVDFAYDPKLVGASVVIAVTAATAALWAALAVRATWHTVGAALVMGVAVSGMHYTGMAAMDVHDMAGTEAQSGVKLFDLLFPLLMAVVVVVLGLLAAVLISPAPEEAEAERAPAEAPRERPAEGTWDWPGSRSNRE